MLIFTQIKSQMGYDSLDAILAPNDTAALLGFPSASADYPEVVRIHANIKLAPTLPANGSPLILHCVRLIQ